MTHNLITIKAYQCIYRDDISSKLKKNIWFFGCGCLAQNDMIWQIACWLNSCKWAFPYFRFYVEFAGLGDPIKRLPFPSPYSDS